MDSDIAARVRAAVAYSGKTRKQFAAAINTSAPTLDRMTSKTTPRPPKVEEMQLIARASGLPPEWFTVELERLAEIAEFPPPLADPAEDLAQALEDAARDHAKPRRGRARKRAANGGTPRAAAPRTPARRKAQ